MLYEGAQKNIQETDKNGYDFSLCVCEQCEESGSANLDISVVETPYGPANVHDECKEEYLKILSE